MAGELRILAVSVFSSHYLLSLQYFSAVAFYFFLLWRACKCNMNSTPARRVTPPRLESFTWKNATPADRATRLGGLPHLSCKHDQIKIRDYMERRVTPPRRVTSPTWGPPPPCKQALRGRKVRNGTCRRPR